MRIEIFEDGSKEDVLRLRLIHSDKIAGGVMLCAVDKNGDRISGGNILAITRSGHIDRRPDCKAPGLKTGVVDGTVLLR